MPQFDAILALDGELPDNDIFTQTKYKKIIAADGAAWRLKQRGINPDIIIGDLDTLSQRVARESAVIHDVFPDSKIIQQEDQETTDYYKALNYSNKSKLNKIMVIGMFGKESDHALFNIDLFMRFKRKLNLIYYHDYEMDIPQWGFPIYKRTSLVVPVGAKVSIIPMPSMNVSADGLKWPLDNKLLEFGKSTSARNQASHSDIEIKVHKGSGVCIVSSKIRPKY